MNKIYIILLSVLSFFYANNTYSAPTLKVYKFNIKGKVQYASNDDIIGAYGSKVLLYMRKKVNKSLSIPVGISLNPNDLTSILNAKGEFNFNLQFQADLHEFDRISLVVVPGGDHGSVHHYDAYYKYLSNTSWGNIKAVHDDLGYSANVVELGFNDYQPVQEHNYNLTITMTPQFGSAIRTLKYAYDCSNNMLNRLGMDKKVNSINIYIKKTIEASVSNASGAFHHPEDKIIWDDEPGYILLKEGASTQTTVSHEYGHYFHYVLNYTHFPALKSQDIYDNGETNYSREAIAEFYGRVIRGYISDKSGIPVPHHSNFEKIPFDDDRFASAAYNSNGRQVPRRAAYLWNIYDGPTQINVGTASSGSDNDDVDGGRNGIFKNIFKVIQSSTLGELSNFSTFNTRLKGKFVSEDLIASIQKVYDCMMGDGSTPMRPVQVMSAKMTDLPYTNEQSLKITLADYPYGLYYANTAQGYNFSAKKDGNWYVIKQLPVGNQYNEKEFIFKSTDVKDYSEFRITTFNQSGNACFPLTVEHQKLNVSITGSSQIDADKIYMWKPAVGGGQAPYTYQWRIRKTSADNYLNLDPDKADNETYTTGAPNGESFVIDVLVTDKNGIMGFAQKTVNVIILPLAVNINGPYKVGANLEGSWTAEVSGGVPPYSYKWSKDVEDGPTYIYFNQGKDLKTNAGVKPFDLKLTVEDSKNKNMFATKHIFIDQAAPLHVELSGDKIAYLHKPGLWKVNITGGSIPYKGIVFKKRKEGTNAFSILQFNNGESCEALFTEEGVYYLKALITDNNNNMEYSNEFKVTVLYQPVYAEIKNVITQYYGGTYYVGAEADPSAGILPYYYYWSIGHTLNDLKPIPGGNKVKLDPIAVTKIPGKYVLALRVADAKWNSVVAYKYITLGDPLDVTLPPPPGPPQPGYINNDINISSYPNPTTGTTTISYELKEASMVNITTVNVRTGQKSLIAKERQAAGKYQLTRNLSALPGGVYEIQIMLTENNREKIYTSSLILVK